MGKRDGRDADRGPVPRWRRQRRLECRTATSARGGRRRVVGRAWRRRDCRARRQRRPFRDTAVSSAVVNKQLANRVRTAVDAGRVPVVVSGSCNAFARGARRFRPRSLWRRLARRPQGFQHAGDDGERFLRRYVDGDHHWGSRNVYPSSTWSAAPQARTFPNTTATDRLRVVWLELDTRESA